MAHNQRFTLRINERTRQNLELLSKINRRTQSDIIRLLIDVEAEELEERRTESDNPEDD